MSNKTSLKTNQALIDALLPCTHEAGRLIMEIYRSDFTHAAKADGSPVTEADKQAEEILLSAIRTIAPNIDIISEENEASHALSPPERFFLVDPLDGTKEFLKPNGTGSFTVNIGLIEAGLPVAGIVFAPALGALYTGIVGGGASLNGTPICVRAPDPNNKIAVASASHRDTKTNDWLAASGITETISIGSSLKFCLLAEGRADVYPRFGPTMEWDTAAGHAVLRSAGGNIYHTDGQPFTYGKDGYRNGAFIAETH